MYVNFKYCMKQINGIAHNRILSFIISIPCWLHKVMITCEGSTAGSVGEVTGNGGPSRSGLIRFCLIYNCPACSQSRYL